MPLVATKMFCIITKIYIIEAVYKIKQHLQTEVPSGILCLLMYRNSALYVVLKFPAELNTQHAI